MRYLKSPALVIGVILTTSAIVAMWPSFQADLEGFPDSSWDFSAAAAFSPPYLGALFLGVALIATSVPRLRSRKKPD